MRASRASEEALQIFRDLAQKNPEAYLPDVATTLSNLGVLNRDQKQMEEARKEFGRDVADSPGTGAEKPGSLSAGRGGDAQQHRVLCRKQNRTQEAKQAYEQALQIYEVIAKQDPQRFSADVTRMKHLLVGLPT